MFPDPLVFPEKSQEFRFGYEISRVLGVGLMGYALTASRKGRCFLLQGRSLSNAVFYTAFVGRKDA